MPMFRLLLITTASFALLPHAKNHGEETALDRYIQADDDSFEWKVVHSTPGDGFTTVIIDMTSQTWRSPSEVNRTRWQHWIKVVVPDKVASDIGFLMIGGGSNGKDPPTKADDRMVQLAKVTNTVVAELEMIPNQPLIFHNDGEPRVEDNLIGYTWDQYLKTGDATWLARGPMTKSAVRAMDAVTAMVASDAGGGQKVQKYVVAGGSKRGWTTWITAAVDKRVVAIIPIVIDVLNSTESMKHHFAAYGFWAPSIGDYVRHRMTDRMDHPRYDEIRALVDPLSYRDRLTMPKFVLNAAGDQFFLPDSSQFYWDQLVGPKSLRYVPNTDHGMDGSDAFESLTAFYSLVLRGKNAPQLNWSTDGGKLIVKSSAEPTKVLLWQATNPIARDFRKETFGANYTSTPLDRNDDGSYSAQLTEPERGWTASFIEATFDVSAQTPLKLTTSVYVTPDVLPFAAKDAKQSPSLTVTCEAQNEQVAAEITSMIKSLAAAGKLQADQLSTERIGSRIYFNWRPALAKFRSAASGLTDLLQEKGCTQFAYQLESGLGATLPPGLADEASGN